MADMPILEKNTETGALRIIWPDVKPEGISMTVAAFEKVVKDINNFRAADALAIAMLEDYRNHKTVSRERWAALQKIRRRVGLKK